ncbi:sodium- and chloride-dependent GABA transporter 2-like [Antennarius striatus]|uniref:sodium- and chloride-dependent GABA transporter 2-like n=1 Tax=Antennarius striatus TaxID=241820 RepID=UPI0035B11460
MEECRINRGGSVYQGVTISIGAPVPTVAMMAIEVASKHNRSWHICVCIHNLQQRQTIVGTTGAKMKRNGRKKEKQSAIDRGQWASKREYFLVVAGSVVGLGNVWRFPYLCFKNGGGAFLVPYGLLAVFVGIPLFLLEISMGQYTQEGFVTCWTKLCPLARGIGIGQLIILFFNTTYILIEAWALFYLVFSFRSQLPWATCNNTWNTADCFEVQMVNSSTMNTTQTNGTSAAIEFWERRMLAMSGGIEELGSVRWELTLCLLIAWIFCYFSIWKGVRSSGKAAYFTATFPYVMLLILLIRGLTLPGAFEGIYYYLYPDINRLADLEVWIEAGSQIFFSYSLTGGILTVMGSYNKYNNNCYKDCVWICLLNSGTSFLAGFVVFSVLGFMAHEQGVSVETVTDSGPGLAFIAYPQATALMPLPQFWTVCFFLMLILLTVDTHFVAVESFISANKDVIPKSSRAAIKHEILVLIICVSLFLLNLTMVTEGGIYVFQLIDFYGATRACQNFMAVGECLAIGWIFGVDRLSLVIEDMTGQRQSAFFNVCWKFIIPIVSLISFILYLVDNQHLKINDYVYPDWAYALGWIMTFSSVAMVPLWAAGLMCLTPGTFRQRLSALCAPAEDPARWRKELGEEGTAIELTSAVTS